MKYKTSTQRIAIKDVIDSGNLNKAALHVISRKGCAGRDGVTCSQFKENKEENIKDIAGKVQNSEYEFIQLDEKYISKGPGRGKRKLQIPVVADRTLLTAIKFKLDDPVGLVFSDVSYCKKKGGQQKAAQKFSEFIKAGYIYVVETDIEKCFDNTRPADAYKALRPFVDRQLMGLIKKFIKKSNVNDPQWKKNKGIPQGAPLSSMFSNLVLDQFDIFMTSRNTLMVRYADNVFVATKSRQTARKKLLLIRKILRSMGLKLNPEKTRITKLTQGKVVEFIGYEIDHTGRILTPEKKRKEIMVLIDRLDYIRFNPKAFAEMARRIRDKLAFNNICSNVDNLYAMLSVVLKR